MNKLFASSANPEKLALTLRGLIPLVLFLAVAFGFQVVEGDLNELINSIVNFIVAIGVAASGFFTLVGIIRKIVIGIKKK